MLNKLKNFYQEYKEYIRTDLVVYVFMFTVLIAVFIVILLKK